MKNLFLSLFILASFVIYSCNKDATSPTPEKVKILAVSDADLKANAFVYTKTGFMLAGTISIRDSITTYSLKSPANNDTSHFDFRFITTQDNKGKEHVFNPANLGDKSLLYCSWTTGITAIIGDVGEKTALLINSGYNIDNLEFYHVRQTIGPNYSDYESLIQIWVR